MKSLIWSLPIGLLTLVRVALAGPFDESKGPEFYNQIYPIDKEVNLPVGTSVDDYIIAMSKASEIDFLLDSTSISKEERVKPYPSNEISKGWKQSPTGVSFMNLLSDLQVDKNITDLRYDQSTYLLWSRPSAEATAKLIVASHGEQPKAALPDEFELFRELNDLVKDIPSRHLSPDGATSLWSAQISKQSPILRSQLKTLAQHALLRPELRRELLLTDEYWKNARIHLALRNVKGERVAINGVDEKGQPTSFFRLKDGGAEYSFIFPQGNQATDVYERPGIINGSWRFNPTISISPSNPVAPPPTEVVPVELGLNAKQLAEDPALNKVISLEFKRIPLHQLLSETLGKFGLKLVMKDDVAAKDSLVTVNATHMTLDSFMGAISRLYSVYWTQQNQNEFVLNNTVEDDLSATIKRFGRGGVPEFIMSQWRTRPQQREARLVMEQEVLDALAGVTPDADGTIAFSQLPEGLRNRIISDIKENTANRLVCSYMQSKILVSDQLNAILTWTVSKPPSFPQMVRGNAAQEDPFRLAQWQIVYALPSDETHLHGTELAGVSLYGPPLPNVIQDAAQAPLAN